MFWGLESLRYGSLMENKKADVAVRLCELNWFGAMLPVYFLGAAHSTALRKIRRTSGRK